MTEARLVRNDSGWLEPEGDGWYVLNATDARWLSNEMGWYCNFEGAERFQELGLNINFLPPGKPIAMYHHEPHQEGFFLLRGDAILVVEGEEHSLRRWDYVHFEPGVAHVVVGAGEGALVLAVGGRIGGGGATYPVDAAAVRHDAGVTVETSDPRQAYARFGAMQSSKYPGGLMLE